MTALGVSVIIPTYNRAMVIGEAIESVLAQTVPAAEIIVVDDGSTDDTAHRLQPYADRLTLLHQENKGAAAARNRGIEASSQPWLTFLDSDDLWLENRLEILARDLKAAPTSVVAHAAIGRTKTGTSQKDPRAFPRGEAVTVDTPLEEAFDQLYLPSFAMARAEAFRNGLFRVDLPVHEDALLMAKLALEGPWRVTGDGVCQYRRLAEDDAALMGLEHRAPDAFYQSRIDYNRLLLEDPRLSPEQRKRVARDLSGAHFQKAAACHRQGRGKEIYTDLWQSIRRHPSPPKAALRALAPVVLGKRGFNIALGPAPVSSHPGEAACAKPLSQASSAQES